MIILDVFIVSTNFELFGELTNSKKNNPDFPYPYNSFPI